jgi:hypothetical protein
MEVGKENLYDAIKNKKFSNLIEKGAVCIEVFNKLSRYQNLYKCCISSDMPIETLNQKTLY